MGAVYAMVGEVTIHAPSGRLTVAHAKLGSRGRQAVVVTGSQPRWKIDWYIDTLKAARERICTGQNPQGFLLQSTETLENKEWHMKTFQAAEDAVRRYKPEKQIGRPATHGMSLPGGYKLWLSKRK